MRCRGLPGTASDARDEERLLGVALIRRRAPPAVGVGVVRSGQSPAVLGGLAMLRASFLGRHPDVSLDPIVQPAS